MEIIVDLSLFSEFFYSTFLEIDQFLFSSFKVKTSFADNTDQTIVYILAFILVCGLLGLLSSDRKERNQVMTYQKKVLSFDKTVKKYYSFLFENLN